MHSLFHVRVVVKLGVAGALGRVTRALEHLDARISSIDLQPGSGNTGICDLCVSLDKDRASVDVIGDALREHKAGVVSEITPIDHVVDPVLRAIRWASNLVGAGSLANDELKRIVGEICRTDDTWFLSLEEAERVEIASEAAHKWMPVSRTVTVTPDNVNVSFEGPAVMLAVPDARLEPTGVALVARPAAQMFSPTEIDRVEAILGLRRRAAVLDPSATQLDEGYEGYWFDATSY